MPLPTAGTGDSYRDSERKEDPAKGHPNFPPNFGRDLFPHPVSFTGFVASISHAYRPSDEALKHSMENARFMRNDCFVMECLEARIRGTALLNWHLEPDNPEDEEQKGVCAELTKIINMTKPGFTEMRRWLMEAIWFGRVATQNTLAWDLSGNKRRLYIRRWQPIHGDKLVFRFDDGSGKYDPEQIGIKYTQAYGKEDHLGGYRKLEPTDYGMAYFLQPWERALVTMHRHMIEDAPYEDPQSAGRIHGVGIRDRIYWTWFQRQEALGMLMELIERTGQGFNIWYFPTGNAAAKNETIEAAKNQTGQNSIIIPRTPGLGENEDGYGFQRYEPTGAGVDALKMIVHELFGHQIKRYILGQTLSSESDATGLGSGVADLHLESFLQIIRYDAANLEESLTADLVYPLKYYNFPNCDHFNVKFRVDTEHADVQSRLQSMFQAWSMGLKIRAQDVYDVIGLQPPNPEDDVLENPELTHQLELAKLHHINAEKNEDQAIGAKSPGKAPTQALMTVLSRRNGNGLPAPKGMQAVGDHNVAIFGGN